jgi:hypothetical protein
MKGELTEKHAGAPLFNHSFLKVQGAINPKL